MIVSAYLPHPRPRRRYRVRFAYEHEDDEAWGRHRYRIQFLAPYGATAKTPFVVTPSGVIPLENGEVPELIRWRGEICEPEG